MCAAGDGEVGERLVAAEAERQCQVRNTADGERAYLARFFIIVLWTPQAP